MSPIIGQLPLVYLWSSLSEQHDKPYRRVTSVDGDEGWLKQAAA